MIIEIDKNAKVTITENFQSVVYTLSNPVPNPEPVPTPINPKVPNGKGMLIWQLAKIANGHMPTMAAQAKDAGFNWISIKVVENGFLYVRNEPFIKAAINELRKVGIGVRGWGYLYPQNAAAQGKRTAEVLKSLELDGYELDVEGEWKTNIGDFRQAANEYCSEYRNGVPDLGTGLCSFRYPKSHPLPWKEFLNICDYHAPQVYWVGATLAGSPETQLQRSYKDLKELKDIPYVPIGISCSHPNGDKIWNPTVEQMNNFYITCKEFGFPGHGWYDFINAYNNQVWWNAIKSHK